MMFSVFVTFWCIICAWLLVCAGILAVFIPDLHILEVEGEKEFLESKRGEADKNAKKGGEFAFLFNSRHHMSKENETR